jgi:heme/copper-type cytochrome/quinol oxidase subunit 3
VERRPEPRAGGKILPDGVVGILLFIFTEAMLFAAFISAFVIVKSQAAGEMWPPYGQPRLPVESTAINTAALILSGLVMVFAHFAYRKSSRRAVLPFGVAILLGLFFVGFQGVEWARLLAEGLTIQSSSYGGFFYLIVGCHAIHAIGAILAGVWAWTRLVRDDLSRSQLLTVELFWYFVVLVWPVLYWKVYLS